MAICGLCEDVGRLRGGGAYSKVSSLYDTGDIIRRFTDIHVVCQHAVRWTQEQTVKCVCLTECGVVLPDETFGQESHHQSCTQTDFMWFLFLYLCLIWQWFMSIDRWMWMNECCVGEQCVCVWVWRCDDLPPFLTLSDACNYDCEIQRCVLWLQTWIHLHEWSFHLNWSVRISGHILKLHHECLSWRGFCLWFCVCCWVIALDKHRTHERSHFLTDIH